MDPSANPKSSPLELAFGEPGETLQEVEVPFVREGGWGLPIALCTIHDGHRVPACAEEFARGLDPELLEQDFTRERDWGADAVAMHLAWLLRLPSYHRVTTARVFLDCGRPAGVSAPEDRGLDTKSVPFSIAGRTVPEELAASLLEVRESFARAFDGLLERTLAQARRHALDSGALFLAIHTYDRYGESGERAPVSLVYRPRIGDEVPEHFPTELLHGTSDAGLIRRLDRSFRIVSVYASHNEPYVLPAGGLEIPAVGRMFEHGRAQGPGERPHHPRRRPSALVLEYRKDLLCDGENTEGGWFRPRKGAWKRGAIRELAKATAGPVLAHFAEIDPGRFRFIA